MANLLEEEGVEAPDEKGAGDGAADYEEVVREGLVRSDDGRIRW